MTCSAETNTYSSHVFRHMAVLLKHARWFQKKWVLLIPFVMSVAIETTQYVTGLGIAEFDDVFGNTMGGWIGVLVAWTWLSRKMSVKNRA